MGLVPGRLKLVAHALSAQRSNAGGILHDSADAIEARRAFVEKRRPDFTGT